MEFSTRIEQHFIRHVRFYTALLWVIAASIAIQLVLPNSDSPFLLGRYNDPDDQLRLKQVKDLLGLAGADPKSWFDLHEPRISPPLGLDSHWSRLLDGALALVVIGLKPFFGVEKAIFLMQYFWPLALLLPMLWLAYATGKTLYNRTSGLCGLFYLTFSSIPAFLQFHPGRIDHHNIQSLLVFAGLYACLRLDGSARRAVVSGLLMALSLAIGYETLPFLLLFAVVVAWRYIALGHRREWTGFLIAASFGSVGLLLAQTAPERIFYPACDALGFNMVVMLVSAAATSLMLIGSKRPQTPEHRFRLMFFPAIFAVMIGFAYDPTYIYGPYGERAKELWALWLDNVLEIQPTAIKLDNTPIFLLVFAPVLGGAMAATICKNRLMSWQRLLLFGILIISAIMAKTMVRNIAYPSIFAAPLIGLGIVVALEEAKKLVQRLGVYLAALISIPMVMSCICFIVLPGNEPEPKSTAEIIKCDRPEDFEVLKKQSPGRVATPINLALPVLMATSHSVTAAPYHRLVEPILTTIKAFDGDEKNFLEYLAETSSQYVVLCNINAPEKLKGSSVTARLLRSETIDRLEPLTEPPALVNGQPAPRAKPLPVLIWRVHSTRQQ